MSLTFGALFTSVVLAVHFWPQCSSGPPGCRVGGAITSRVRREVLDIKRHRLARVEVLVFFNPLLSVSALLVQLGFVLPQELCSGDSEEGVEGKW